LLDQPVNPEWVSVAAQYGVDDDRLTVRLASEVANATTAPERERWARLLVALKPGTTKSQRHVADLIIQLLGRNVKADFNVAVTTVGALGPNHRSADPLRRAFVDSTATLGTQVPQKAVEALARVGVRLPKKSMPEKVYHRLKKSLGL
jgi:hypothetical protein